MHRGSPTEHSVFESLNLTLKKGDWVNVIGGNGAGKSTLLNVIAGTVLPLAGEVILDGTTVTHKPVDKRAVGIGRVFQDPLKGSWPTLTIEENLSLAMRRGNPYRLVPALSSKNRHYIQSALAELDLGLENRLKTQMYLLSGGQRQAISLLMATIRAPKLLLLDEHTAALDPKMAKKVLNLSCQLVQKSALTVLMVTHNMHQALEFGNRTILLKEKCVFKEWYGEERNRLSAQDLMDVIES